MVRIDLTAAGIPYEDASGRVFDFHAIRHQFISSPAAAGVHPKVVQILARHSSITLTMDRYTHMGLLTQTAALEMLPALPIRERHAEPLAATGTEGAHSPQHSPAVEVRCVRLSTGEPSENVGMKNSHPPERLGRDATCALWRLDEDG
jgi:hypothetical protein